MWSGTVAARAYVHAHTWLVGRTRAYQRLFAEIARAVSDLDLPADRPGLLVPSSTGDLLPALAGIEPRWCCVDLNEACLQRCALLAPGSSTLRADLDRVWPLERERAFALAISLHSLHYLRDPAALVRRVGDALVAGGAALWIVFAGEGTRPEGVGPTLRRIARQSGPREALNFVPWKLLDAAVGLAARPRHFWAGVSFVEFLRACGHDVVWSRPTFNGCSIIALSTPAPEDPA